RYRLGPFSPLAGAVHRRQQLRGVRSDPSSTRDHVRSDRTIIMAGVCNPKPLTSSTTGQCASSFAYTARVASLTASHEYRVLAYSRIPGRRLPNALNRSLWKYASMARARSTESRVLHRNPVSPSIISSPKDPTSVAITGSPNPYPKMSTPLWNTSVYGS